MKFFSLPVQLLFACASAVMIAPWISLDMARLFYTLSILFKDFLGLLLPFIVFSFVATGILSFKKNAPKVLGITLATITLSNFCAAIGAYCVARLFLWSPTGPNTAAQVINNPIVPFFTSPITSPIRAEHALLFGIGVGLALSFYPHEDIKKAIVGIKDCVNLALRHLVIPFLPLYVFGFLLKLVTEGHFTYILNNYFHAIVLIAGFHAGALWFLYYLASGFSIPKTLTALHNELPVYLTGFSTMSSAASIPVSIEAAYKNTNNQELSNSAMPVMANIHLLGTVSNNTILAMVTLLLYKGSIPGFAQFASFALYLTTSLFAMSGIPGGGILVVMPLLASQLNFTAEMISIMTTIYLMLDPLGTAANITGDGAIVMIVDKILKRLKIQ